MPPSPSVNPTMSPTTNTTTRSEKKDSLPDSIPGTFFEGAAHPDLQEVHPLYTFIPKTLLRNGQLDEKKYVQSHWAAINCAANSQKAIGSHLFPDLSKPLDKKNIDKDFLEKLKTYLPKSLGPETPLRKPGLSPKTQEKEDRHSPDPVQFPHSP